MPTLVAALESEDPGLRRGAADALGSLREVAKDSVPALRRLNAGDPDPRVRETAARALREIGGTLDEVAREVEVPAAIAVIVRPYANATPSIHVSVTFRPSSSNTRLAR